MRNIILGSLIVVTFFEAIYNPARGAWILTLIATGIVLVHFKMFPEKEDDKNDSDNTPQNSENSSHKGSKATRSNAKSLFALNNIKKFGANNKKTLLLTTLVFLVMIGGWNHYSEAQEREAICLEAIEYRLSGEAYFIDLDPLDLFGEKDRVYFKTQDEALNYCLKVIMR